ncbi:MAG: 16S rRNA (cytidine(1402)-2'-O)-methyltransferase [Flavobacteriaceae bacterium]|nr:16S rRNA (cytidine(1402)-2'-O)-methyltransferase [Flavobacteriaceae bacterium]
METTTLYIVPTPIGNLRDITLRALEVLKSVSVIYAEDTRTSSKLLKHYSIDTPLQAYHMHNEHKIYTRVLATLEEGRSVALISDAGTPGISDPGFLLVRKAVERNLNVEVLPGAVAFIPALVGSGIPCDRFVFEGFLPVKKGRQKRLLALADEHRTMVFYEAPHKLLKTLTDFSQHFGHERKLCVAKELTKLHEQFFRGTIHEASEYFKQLPSIKGEFVIVLEGK